VVLLRSGNAFSLGQSWQDVLFLSQSGISYQIIPAVLQVQAAALCCGIPLLHEPLARSAQIVDVRKYLKGSAAQWSYLTADSKTLIQEISPDLLTEYCAGLVANGMPDKSACLVVSRCGCDDQSVLAGNLKTVAGQVRRKNFSEPLVLIVGEVAMFAKLPHWLNEMRSMQRQNLFREGEALGQS